MSTFKDHEWHDMVPLRCQMCGEQIGLRSQGAPPSEDIVVVRCYRCAVVEEAESITADAENNA